MRKQQRVFIPGGSEPPGPGVNAAGLALYRYKTRCGTMYGHSSGNTFGFTQYAAASSDGSRSMTISINLQRTHENEGAGRSSVHGLQKGGSARSLRCTGGVVELDGT